MKKTLLLIVLMFAFALNVNSQTYTDFTLTDLENNDVTLSSLLEQGPVMLSFWATWCTPCKEELKKMEEIYLKYKDQGFSYVAMNIDNQKSVAKVKSYITSQGFSFVVLMDSDKRVFESYGGKEDEVPYYVIIKKDKTVMLNHLGFKTGDEREIELHIQESLKK